MSIDPVGAVSAVPTFHSLSVAQPAGLVTGAGSFAQMLLGGAAAVEQKVAAADAAVRAFVVDDSIPVHQVTFALEEARLSLELMMQVRTRLVESYQRIMEMQL